MSRHAPTYDEVLSVVSEGFHTAFRNVGFTSLSDDVWHLINRMSDEEWQNISTFAVVDLVDLLGIEVPDSSEEV